MIECSHVSFSYDGQARALSDVSLSVADGEFVCILGSNGSGKSTLARHLNALLVPDSGRVLVDGMDTADPALTLEVRSRVGMVFQSPDDQIVASVVEDEIAFGPENLAIEGDELARRVRDALSTVGLTGFERRDCSELSGGQKQRLAIAGSIAMHPGTLVLDEASSMLDPRGRRSLMRVCRELNADGMAIVMVTHRMEEAACAERVVVLDHGRMAAEGTPDEVLSRAEWLVGMGLEAPFPYRLSLELARRGVGVAPSIHADALVSELAQAARGGAEAEGPAQAAEHGTEAEGPAAPAPGRPEESHGTPRAASPKAILCADHTWFSYDPHPARDLGRTRARGVAWGPEADDAWALEDVSLDVVPGTVTGLAGHTGSGKSTLIQLLGGLERPSAGRVLLDGRELGGRHGVQAAGRVGVVFQYPERQLFAPTVRDDVAFGPRNLGITGEQLASTVDRALRRVGLDPDAVGERSPFELSGGQMRRVAFAGVLAMGPSVMVFDEPGAGLDPRSRREFARLVRTLRDQGLAIVLSSHDMDELAALCDTVAVLDRGRVLCCGTPEQVFSDPEGLRRIGLGVPQACELAERLRDAGLGLGSPERYRLESLADDVARALGTPTRTMGGAR